MKTVTVIVIYIVSQGYFSNNMVTIMSIVVQIWGRYVESDHLGATCAPKQ